MEQVRRAMPKPGRARRTARGDLAATARWLTQLARTDLSQSGYDQRHATTRSEEGH
jgi:hypothetical protein